MPVNFSLIDLNLLHPVITLGALLTVIEAFIHRSFFTWVKVFEFLLVRALIFARIQENKSLWLVISSLKQLLHRTIVLLTALLGRSEGLKWHLTVICGLACWSPRRHYFLVLVLLNRRQSQTFVGAVVLEGRTLDGRPYAANRCSLVHWRCFLTCDSWV